MANNTVYPFGPGGQLPSGIGIINDLKTGGANKALSAQQGKVLNENGRIYITPVVVETVSGKYIESDGTFSDTGDSAKINKYIGDFSKKDIIVSGRVSSRTRYAMVAYYTKADVFISSALLGDGEAARNYEDEPLTAPENTGIVRVQGNSNYVLPSLTLCPLVKDYVSEGGRSVFPFLEYGSIVAAGGFSEMQVAAGGTANVRLLKTIRTPKYIKVGNNPIFKVKSSVAVQYRAFYYDKDFSLVTACAWATLTANTDATLQAAGEYVRFTFRADSSYTNNLPMFTLELTGDFDADCEYKNVRSADSGYQTVAVMVRPINAGVSNAETNAVQDNETPAYDYGLLVLPESYRNTGRPTRLIIYCHGAGVNYGSSTTRFPSNNFLPEYWLSEGYAVLDMDGEFYATEHQHAYMPEARQSYIAGYNWVVENYNIRKDGVFLGGRSMGGGMCFDLMESGIPVIAACPVVPVCNTLWWWNYSPAQYREDCAGKMGFVGTAPTWTSDNPMSQSEWDYLYANFEKMVKYSPLWRCIADLPGKDVLFNGTRIASTATSGAEVEAEADIFKDLHARVKCPVKMFDNYSDPTVPYNRNALLMYGMLVNAGQICELRMFDVSGDSDTSLSAHFFELRSDRKVSWTNSFGVSLTGVPVVYIEMLAFWRRYEQVNGSY